MGHEKTLTGLIPALAGANLIYGPGMLESGITFDYAQLVLDSEFIRMIKHVVNGFTVDRESLAVDLIKSVGMSGDFISQMHTLEHMQDHSQPELMDRRRMEKWQAAGARDSYQQALEKTRYILQNHQPDPLPSKVQKELKRIIKETEKELKEKK
jgi:trimethylamine--corrinoid protein Co-methyltransferase